MGMLADLLDTAADALGRAMKCVDDMVRRDIETIRSEPAAADVVAIEGPLVIRALRSLSLRYAR